MFDNARTSLTFAAGASRKMLAPQDLAYDDSRAEFNVDSPNGVVMEGYLFKRAGNAFKTWNRCGKRLRCPPSGGGLTFAFCAS